MSIFCKQNLTLIVLSRPQFKLRNSHDLFIKQFVTVSWLENQHLNCEDWCLKQARIRCFLWMVTNAGSQVEGQAHERELVGCDTSKCLERTLRIGWTSGRRWFWTGEDWWIDGLMAGGWTKTDFALRVPVSYFTHGLYLDLLDIMPTIYLFVCSAFRVKRRNLRSLGRSRYGLADGSSSSKKLLHVYPAADPICYCVSTVEMVVSIKILKGLSHSTCFSHRNPSTWFLNFRVLIVKKKVRLKIVCPPKWSIRIKTCLTFKTPSYDFVCIY